MLYQQFYAINPTTGAAIAGCQVGVYDYSNALTSLFDQNGAPITNPMTADSTGKVGFAAADGVYSYRFMVGGTVVAAILTVQIVDALALKASVAAEATRAETAEYDLGLDILAEAARARAAEGSLAVLAVSGDLTPSEIGSIAVEYGAAANDLSNVPSSVIVGLRGYITPEQFGAVGDGVTDDSAAIRSAIAYCVANNKRGVLFDELVYACNNIALGNGSTSQFSTVNGVRLIGSGFGYMRQGVDSPLSAFGTRLLYNGAAGGELVSIEGPCVGNDLTDMVLDGANLADTTLLLTCASLGRFPRLAITRFRNRGLHSTTLPVTTVAGTSEMVTSASNHFGTLWVDGGDYGVAPTVCVDFDGSSTGNNTTRSHIDELYTIIRRDGSTAIRFGYTDQDTVKTHVNTCVASASGADQPLATAAVRAVATTDQYGNLYPQNIDFLGHADGGQDCLDLSVDGGVIYSPVRFAGRTVLDQQIPLTYPSSRSARAAYSSPGQYPQGGVQTEAGDIIAERQGRNALINAGFQRNTRGTSGTITSGGRLSDLWRTYFDGSLTGTWQVLPLPLGQLDLPIHAREFLRLTVTAASACSYFFFSQQVEDVDTFHANSVCSSLYARDEQGNAPSLLGSRIEQAYGTGGSPTATQASTNLLPSSPLSGSWSRPQWRNTLQGTSGNTKGTNGDSAVNCHFLLPINQTFTIDVALPQFELGVVATASEPVSITANETRCARYLQAIGGGATGQFFTSSSLQVAQRISPPMRAAPNLSVNASSITVTSPGNNAYTASPPTLGGPVVGLDYALFSLTGFTGGPVGDAVVLVTSDAVLASAEFG